MSLPHRPLLRICHAALLATVCMGSAAVALAAPAVAVSIKPLEHLAAQLTAGVATPALVVRPGQDPHHISLRPSERRVLAEADILLWVGPSLELPLAELTEQVDASVITAQQLGGMRLIGAGETLDPHLWLDTYNAGVIAEALVQQLSELDPGNSSVYRRNLEDLQKRMQTLRQDIEQQLERDGRRAWAVYHHAFRYPEGEFALPPALLLRDSDNAEPGLRSVMAFRAALQSQGISCVLIEPDVPRSQLQALLDDSSLRTVEADVLGVALPVQEGSFVALLRGVMAAIQDCAGERHD